MGQADLARRAVAGMVARNAGDTLRMPAWQFLNVAPPGEALRVEFIGLSLAGMEIELSRVLRHKAEMHTVKGLHPQFRDEVLNVAKVQYEQA